MDVKENAALKINGITLLLMLVFSSTCLANPPAPACRMDLQLAEWPAPRTATIRSMPVQRAQANASFHFNLNPFVSLSQLELSYRVRNDTVDIPGKTAEVLATSVGMPDLPRGLILTRRNTGDCSSPFLLLSHDSCLLHFYVDNEQYSSEGTSGPFVSVHMRWFWGSHKNRLGEEDMIAKHYPFQSFAQIIAPAMLPIQVLVKPTEQDGLHYDALTSSIIGRPTKTGDYHFSVSATNGTIESLPQDLHITVNQNPQDTPVFRPIHRLASAMPEREYRLNLLDLIEPLPGLAETNQVSFRIDKEDNNPRWLSLDKKYPTLLTGHPSATDAGHTKEITLIATSNTGGDSLPMTIQIPVAFDREKRPTLDPSIKFAKAAGETLNVDLRENITDPMTDGSLKLILDKVEPLAPWLSIPSNTPTVLHGVVPKETIGQLYQLTLHANTAAGGNSDLVRVPLQIEIDKTYTPLFYSDKPQIPLAYAGLSYFYDFIDCDDVVPAYNVIPFAVELAQGYNNPAWLHIENNKLIAERVPYSLEKKQPIFITVKNIPGGISKVRSIDLFIMD